MGVIGLDHVQLAIPANGEAEARKFYVGLLEMREVPKPATLAPEGCWFEGGSLRLHIGIDREFRPAMKAHPALLVDDLAGLRTKLDEAGVTVRDGEAIEGYTRLFISDPFGNRIELMERL
ncbi:glyoxalase [Erythrobacter sp. QSSC1-22B]|uniref:VOC family protein n=1 Tax=Erythrobacter sp. QSSC1-22B TaxID=1860125 RepID=UPI0008054E6B|nr:VOC family protein [Erythrobacter sp. QSSC1-22B]OBX17992.1 glyoxalase [Erythrobacter sp. QSSC1-22B]